MNTVIEVGKEDGVATLLLNRPQVLNTLNYSMALQLHQACRELDQDPVVRCVVIRGAGGNFMAGGDIKYFQQELRKESAQRCSGIKQVIAEVHGAITCLRHMPKPVIGGIQGVAAGFGISLVTACDLALAADNAVFTLAYCHIGASPDGGSTWALPRSVGMKRAMELALLGEKFDARRAEAIGLINRVVPEDELQTATQNLAAHFASAPAYALARTKALLNASLTTSLEQQLQAEAEAFADCALTTDFAEGVNAFCEKRTPRFAGH